jgi:hypothetical protein
MMKKKKPAATPNANKAASESPLSTLAQDFKILDDEAPLCERKNDGRD